MAYEQPSRKKQRVTGVGGQAVLHNLQDDPAPPANKNIGFISCPENMRLDTADGVKKLKEAVEDLIDFGTTFISVTSAK